MSEYFPGSAFNPYKSQQASFQTPVEFPVLDLGKTLSVSFQAAWLPYIIGSLKQLVQNATFLASTADEQEDHILQAYDLLRVFQNAQAAGVPFINPVQESEIDMSVCEQLRYHNGRLQGLCCGTWEDIGSDDNTAPTGGGSQPGGGTPQPTPGGGCQTYQAAQTSDEIWFSPTTVSSGDTITVSKLDGAWSVGGLADWYCPDGRQFVTTCLDGIFGDSSHDFLTSAHHMQLIMYLNGTYYNILSGTFTVPGGVTNATPQFMANRVDFSGHSGEITYQVEICNNQAASWSHTFDFTVSPQGWSLSTIGGGTRGAWTAGQGWTNTDEHESPSYWFRGVCIQRSGLSAFEILTCTVNFDLSLGAFDTGGLYGLLVQSGVGSPTNNLISEIESSMSSGTNQTAAGANDQTGQTYMRLILDTDANASSNAGFTGSCAIKSLTITGKGTEPVW